MFRIPKYAHCQTSLEQFTLNESHYGKKTIAEPAGEKISKREFLAENGGKQSVSAELSAARATNKNAPHRQPARAAKTPNAPWTLSTQKTWQPPMRLATESRPEIF